MNSVPDNVSLDEAALAEPLACVINAQELTAVGNGDTVVVMGAGPVGCLHASLAKVGGARKVILVDIRPERLQMARTLGADVLIDGSREDVRARVLQETAGEGASVVIVAAPSHQAQAQSVTLAARRGRINFFGGLPKTDPIIALDANAVHYRELTIVGSYGSRPIHNRMALDLIASGRLRTQPLIGLELPLDRVIDGLLAVEEGRVLKVIAILMRALAVPAVIGVPGATTLVRDGDVVLVDGDRGKVVVGVASEPLYPPPSPVTAAVEADFQPARTRDGVTALITATIGDAGDAGRGVAAGADGIGLFRTEWLFLRGDRLPPEELQRSIYRDVVDAIGPRPLTVRLADLGADKQPAALRLPPRQIPRSDSAVYGSRSSIPNCW